MVIYALDTNNFDPNQLKVNYRHNDKSLIFKFYYGQEDSTSKVPPLVLCPLDSSEDEPIHMKCIKSNKRRSNSYIPFILNVSKNNTIKDIVYSCAGMSYDKLMTRGYIDSINPVISRQEFIDIAVSGLLEPDNIDFTSQSDIDKMEYAQAHKDRLNYRLYAYTGSNKNVHTSMSLVDVNAKYYEELSIDDINRYFDPSKARRRNILCKPYFTITLKVSIYKGSIDIVSNDRNGNKVYSPSRLNMRGSLWSLSIYENQD